MKNSIVLIVLILTLVLPAYADDFQDGNDAYLKGDYKTAFEKFKPLAEERAKAQFVLGVMYSGGKRVTRDGKEAVKWYKRSAKQGLAQLILGLMYESGRGATKDYIQAHMWFNLAGANGQEDGREARERVEKRMTPDQIAEAKRLAREWMEKRK